MANSEYRRVVGRAFREAGEFVRWSNANAIVAAACAVCGTGVFTYLRTGVWSYTVAGGFFGIFVLFSIVFVLKLFTVPVAIIAENNGVHATRLHDWEQQRSKLESQVAVLRNPPKPEGYDYQIYQRGNAVGHVFDAVQEEGFVTFSEISESTGLNRTEAFLYRNQVLYVVGLKSYTANSSTMFVTSDGPQSCTQNAVMGGVRCKILGDHGILKWPEAA